MTTESVKAVVEVTASVMPPEIQFKGGEDLIATIISGGAVEPSGWQKPRPEGEFTKQFPLTSKQWAEGGAEALRSINSQALEYAAELMAKPERFNHVRVDWIWM